MNSLKKELFDIENKLDKLNSNYGFKNDYCIFCHSNIYNGKGIIHKRNCIIQQLRNKINEE